MKFLPNIVKTRWVTVVAAIWAVTVSYFYFQLQTQHEKEMAVAQQALMQRSKHIEGIEQLNSELVQKVRAVVEQLVDGRPLSDQSVADVRNILANKALLANNLLTSFPVNSDERLAIVDYQASIDVVRRNLNQLSLENGVSQKSFLQSVADMLEEQNRLLNMVKELPLTNYQKAS